MSAPFVSVTVPVFNEEERLRQSVVRLRDFLAHYSWLHFEIIIANNGSTDRTQAIAQELCRLYSTVRVVSLSEKGRGRALERAWNGTNAEILSYMDVDLSADLGSFIPMIQAVTSGNYDLAVGSRLHPDAVTKRCWRRELISRCYNLMIRLIFSTRFSDAQCGFKAISRDAAARLLPAVKDTAWFFDTELLLIAEKCGYRILDVPVMWTEDPDSRVKIISTALADVRGLLRVRHNFRKGHYAPLAHEIATSIIARR